MKTKTINLLLLLVLLAGLCVADNIGLFAGIDTGLYDVFFRLRGKRPVSGRIVIAAIDEKTLAAFGKWPIRRSIYGDLLPKLKDAAAVGFDVVLSEPAPDDGAVALAMKRHRRVVLPVYLDRTLKVTMPVSSLSFAAAGHVHVEQGVDHVARDVFHTIAGNGWQIPSLTSAMFRMATGVPGTPPAMPGIVPAAEPVHQTDPHSINFYGPPGTFPQVSVADIAAGRYPPGFFTGKIVLVGLTTPGIIDEVATPFSEERNGMTGVELHANILNNLLDDNRIRQVPDWLRFAAATLLTVVVWVLFGSTSEVKAFIISVTGLLLLSAYSYCLFAAEELWLAPSLLYASISASFMVCHLRQLDETARRLESEHRAITALINGGTAPQQGTTGGLLTLLTQVGINRNIDRLVELQKTYADNLQAAVNSRTRELEEALATIASMSDEMVLRLAWAVESKDKDTSEHTSRLGLYARVIAEELGLPAEFIDSIAYASALHDVGKIGISDNILLKKGPLKVEEMEIIKTHCLIGKRILDNSSFPKIQMCASIALNHHERWDGTGYPNGLKGDDIPLEARIIAVCDCYDSLRSSRPYKEAYDHETALRIMLEGNSRTSPKHFDPVVLEAFRQTAPLLAQIFTAHQD